jgi:hypothetical protein
MPLCLRASFQLVAASAVGCSAPVVDEVADAAGAMTDGVVVVERTVAADGAAQTNVSAKFMRLSTPADPDLAERVVGSRPDLPPVGSCRRVAAESVSGKARGIGSLGAIELIDVGDVTLRTGRSETTLAARAFPDVGDLVSGMFYTSRDAASDLPAGTVYTLEGTGSSLVDHFSIEAEAPAAPEDVRIGDVALGEGPAITAGAATVRWRSERAEQGRGDLVLVDVSAASGASIRCAYPDVGEATVPGWVFADRALGPLPATATLSVHRVRERSFFVSGLDAGAVRFDLSVVGRVTVGPKTAAAQPSQQP